MINNCYQCRYKKDIPGNCHIQCLNPDKKMTGKQHGIDNNWFNYPLLFDPVWSTKKCVNYDLVKLHKLHKPQKERE